MRRASLHLIPKKKWEIPMPGRLSPGAAFALALALPVAFPALAEPVTSFTLDNGLNVVVIEDHRYFIADRKLLFEGLADGSCLASGLVEQVGAAH